MTQLANVSYYRHPELVSGSIGKLALTYRRQTQSYRKINPMRVFGVDKVDLLRAVPVFQLLFTRNSSLHRAESFKMHKAINRIFGGMSRHQTTPVLRQALQQIGGNTDVKRAVEPARKDIDARLFFLSHQQSIAAKWTLKQVQGDVVGSASDS